MFEKLVARLKNEGVEIVSGENGTGKTELANEYLSLVAGGGKGEASDATLYWRFERNHGEPGGPPDNDGGAYWQSITRP